MPMRAAALALAVAAAAFAAPALGVAGPWQRHPEAQVRLISPWLAAPPAPGGGALALGVEVTLAPGWHSYWRNSGDAGFAPSLVVKTPGIEGAELAFPAPRRFELRGGLVAFGYEETVVYPVHATLAVGAGTAGPLAVRAAFDYVVCAEECVPYRDELTLEQPFAAPPRDDAEIAARLAAWTERVPKPAADVALGSRATLREARDGARSLEVELGAPTAPDATLFFPADDRWAIGRPERVEAGSHTRFRMALRPRTAPAPPLAPAEVAWTATGVRVEGRTTAVTGSTRAEPAPRSAFPGIVLWPLAGALALVVAVWLFTRRSP